MDDVVREPAGRFVVAGTVPCATCRQVVDPLRAARVAIFGDRFRYFCSAECRDRYDPNAGRTPLPLPRRAMPRPEDATPEELARLAARRTARALEEVEGDGLSELTRRSSLPPEPPKENVRDGPPEEARDVPAPTDVATLLITIALVAGALSAALVLVGSSPIALTARVVLVLVATGSFVAHAFTTVRDASELHPISATAAPAGAAVATLIARITNHPDQSEVAGFAG
ncbi:MAG TPA: hypothetical protein VHU80_15480, partial [Polyangiaceae bacterium]|nr:hypothetical protein [Polyangiaceae bacterium]